MSGCSPHNAYKQRWASADEKIIGSDPSVATRSHRRWNAAIWKRLASGPHSELRSTDSHSPRRLWLPSLAGQVSSGPAGSSPSAPAVTILLLLRSKLYLPLLPLLLYFAPVAEPPGLCCSATADLRFPQWSLEGNKTLPQDKQQWEPEGPGGGKEEGREGRGMQGDPVVHLDVSKLQKKKECY